MTSQPIIEYFANHSCNLTGLHIFCSNKYNVWYLLLATKFVSVRNVESIFHYHHTILKRSHIEPPTFLALANCWVHNSLDAACSECSVNENTITIFNTSFRDSVIAELTDGELPQIGGKDLDEEIDETVISHRKYNRGRVLSTVWVFGNLPSYKGSFCYRFPRQNCPNTYPRNSRPYLYRIYNSF
ncbi:hypothetical protein M9Y10_005832 [Tritrichomonas musculus]|uniref:Uncharacterized protein n=1 Tax=Tritrichomonas musculus TaxID=1915356 RepID=A0ABR2JDR5_9EUKA